MSQYTQSPGAAPGQTRYDYCMYCGYSLRGLPLGAGQCPECGTGFGDVNPDDDTLFRPDKCNKCQYPFHGLPSSGNCPECGTRYESQQVRLKKCPQCQYSLQGLAENGHCPECGFEYDDKTFMLYGISRGFSTTSPGRVFLWVYVGLVGSGLINVLQLGLEGIIDLDGVGGAIMLAFFLTAAAAAIYLIATGKKEKKGMEPFLFSAGGFGSCGDIDSVDGTGVKLIAWHEVSDVEMERKGKTWHQLRIGTASRHGGRVTKTKLDAGVRCAPARAMQVLQILRERIEHGRYRG